MSAEPEEIFTRKMDDLRAEATTFAQPRMKRIHEALSLIEAEIGAMQRAGIVVRRRYPIGVAETLTSGFHLTLRLQADLASPALEPARLALTGARDDQG